MARKPKPHVHGRDHEHGGADTTLIHYEDVGDSGGGGGGGGIQFDTSPQEGGYLEITTTTGNFDLIQNADGADMNLSANETINIGAGQGVIAIGYGDTGVIIEARGDGDMILDVTASTSASIRVRVDALAGHYLFLLGLPTSNPGGSGIVWNDAGVLKIT